MTDVVSPVRNGQAAPSVQALTLVTESHAIAARALLIDDESGATLDLPLISGSVSQDAKSVIRSTGSLVILAEWSDDPFSRLTPYGSRVAVQRGIRVAPGDVEWVPLMVGRIMEVDESSESRNATLTLSLKDDFARLAADRFDTATQTDTSETVVDAITRLILESIPTATVIDLTGGDTTPCGVMDLQQDRAGGIDKLATSIGAECYCGRDGSFVLRPVPTLADPPRWRLRTGDGGTLIKVDRKRTADGVYNRVLASGDSTAAVGATDVVVPYADAKITDPADPLFYGGPFGRVTRFYKSPLLTTNAQCGTAAAAILEQARGTNYTIGFEQVVNPAVDAGDVIESVISDGVLRRHIIDSVSLPLSTSDSQTVAVRSVELPPEDNSTAGTTTTPGQTTTAPVVIPFRSPTVLDPAVPVDYDDATGGGSVRGSSPLVTITPAQWDALLAAGYQGRPDDGRETLYVPQSALTIAETIGT